MHIITRKRLIEFAARHPNAASGLEHWYRILKLTDFASFPELKRAFPAADQVDNLTVFNIGGNKARLIAAIHYSRKRVYIRNILTHREYNKNRWRT